MSFVFLLLQGNKYWRFDNDILDGHYPRDISVGFEGIPDGVDAAFAIPAPSHLGKEKAYFFKGILVGIHDIFQFLKAPCAQFTDCNGFRAVKNKIKVVKYLILDVLKS